MMPQNLDALFSAMSGAPAGRAVDMRGGASAAGTWAEALALFQAPLEAQELIVDGALVMDGEQGLEQAALDWLEQLAELGDLLEQALAEDTDVRDELVAELESLLITLEASLPEVEDSELLDALDAEIQAAMAELQEQIMMLASEVDPEESDGDASAAMEPVLAALDRLREALAELESSGDSLDHADPMSVPSDGVRAALAAAREAMGRDNDRRSASHQRASLSSEMDRPSREAALSRLAELAALARAGMENVSGRGGSDPNRSVLLTQQFQSLAVAGTGQAGTQEASAQGRPDGQGAVSVAAASAARDPALPPTAQLLGQPAASAGDMRAAAEQAMERVVWMAARQQGVSQARLQLHPAHLGKVDIRLDVQGREASVVLNVQNAPVREAVEAMLPRLREQLEDQGLQLGDASVFDSGPEDSAAEERAEALLADSGNSEEDEQDEAVPVQPELNLRGRGLLDTYA